MHNMSFLYAKSPEEAAARAAKVAQQRAFLDEQLAAAAAPTQQPGGVGRRQAPPRGQPASPGVGFMDGFMEGFGRAGGGAPNAPPARSHAAQAAPSSEPGQSPQAAERHMPQRGVQVRSAGVCGLLCSAPTCAGCLCGAGGNTPKQQRQCCDWFADGRAGVAAASDSRTQRAGPHAWR